MALVWVSVERDGVLQGQNKFVLAKLEIFIFGLFGAVFDGS